MKKLEKILFITAVYLEALILNLSMIRILEGLDLVIWLLFNLWIWIGAPITIFKLGGEEK